MEGESHNDLYERLPLYMGEDNKEKYEGVDDLLWYYEEVVVNPLKFGTEVGNLERKVC